MKRSTSHETTLAILTIIVLSVSTAPTFAATFTTLDAPLGALGTYPSAKFGNNIVGYYQDASYDYHGFLYDGSTWQTLDAPGGVRGTRARGISGNTIVGMYSDGFNSYGFLYDGTTWKTLIDPAAAKAGYGIGDTLPVGIYGGNIVGTFYQGNGGEGGFLYNGSTWTTLQYPGADFTYATGISGGNVVGFYQDNVFGSLLAHGFEYDGSNWTTLDDPLASTGQSGNGVGTYINGAFGTNIVGDYQVSSGGNNNTTHGFLYDGSTWTTIDEPLSDSTFVNNGTSVAGIYENSIIGSYYDTVGFNSPHGFVATVPEPSSRALMLAAAVALFGWLCRRHLHRPERPPERSPGWSPPKADGTLGLDAIRMAKP